MHSSIITLTLGRMTVSEMPLCTPMMGEIYIYVARSPANDLLSHLHTNPSSLAEPRRSGAEGEGNKLEIG